MEHLSPGAIFTMVFPLLFLAVWFGSLYLISRAGGWHALAGVYREQMPTELSRVWRFKYGKMRNATGYNGCLTIGTNARGMRLSLWPMFRPGHPPLFIPWEDISASSVRGFVFEYTLLAFARVPGVTLRLRRDLAGEVLGTRPGVPSSAWHTSPSSSSSR